MGIKLSDEKKVQYDNMLKGAQDLEANIGSMHFRLSKLLKLREDIDGGLKSWWDAVLVELALDPNHDYMVTREGEVEDVTKQQLDSIAPKAAVLPEAVTVDDLK